MADEGFHEIQLSGKHLVALFMAATVVAVVIFLCGVMVGRDVQRQRTAMAAVVSDVASDPTAPVRRSEPSPAPPAASSPAPSTPTPETLSYPDRLARNTAPPESLRPTPQPPPPERAPAPRAEAAAEPAGSGFAVQVAAVGERDEADTIARRLSTKGYPAYVMPPASGTPRVFRVRVGKYRDRREAEQVASRLQREEQFKPWITR